MKNPRRILFLVDNKWRDLPGDTLVAQLLEQETNSTVYLEPLGNWKVSVAEFRPHMVIFNHLTVPHLVNYAKWLRARNIAVVVLPKSGIN